MKKEINIFEAFAGIWSQHQALKNLWYKINVVWLSEWFIDALVVYWYYHLNIKPKKINRKEIINFLKNFSLSLNSKNELKSFSSISDNKLSILYQIIKKFGDLNIYNIKWKDLINKNIDVFTYSFPCQDISQQGKQLWFSKSLKTRSWLLWEIERILKEMYSIDKTKMPKFLLMENVKAILNKNFKKDLDDWIKRLEELGYKNSKPFIVNAKDVGSAQKRERMFMVSSLWKDVLNFKLKEKEEPWIIKDIFQQNMKHNILKLDKNIKIKKIETKRWNKKAKLVWYSNFNAETYAFYMDWQSPTITATGALSKIKVLDENNNIILLNPLEHLLLQWFNKDIYNKMKDVNISDNRIKFLAWNSINVQVLETIFKYYLS